MDDFGSFDPHWVWIAIGLVLAALEMLVPGVYLIWLAVAAIITGLLWGSILACRRRWSSSSRFL